MVLISFKNIFIPEIFLTEILFDFIMSINLKSNNQITGFVLALFGWSQVLSLFS